MVMKLNEGKISPYDKAALIGALEMVYGWLETVPVDKKCISCVAHEKGFCRKYNEKIPEDVFTGKVNCEGYELDASSAPF